MASKSEDWLAMYRLMVFTRILEREIAQKFGRWHPCEGEEAAVVGTFYNLQKDDVVAPHFRGLPTVQYMRGASLRRIWAGIMGKATSYSCGRFGPLRGPFEFNIVGTLSGVLGPSISIATGAALAAKLRGTKQVVLASFGDGTSSRGDIHEAVNFAAVLKLPVVYVCQNNQYAISTPACKGLGCRSVADRAAGYGIPGVEVDGNDVVAVQEVVQEAVKKARQGAGPSLIETRTYRLGGHLAADQALYRSKEEVEEWKKKDPISWFEAKLISLGILAEGMIEQIRKAATEEVLAAMKEAEEDPLPGKEVLGLGEVFAPAKEGGLGR
jgi:TPP-dependent pyruvate/acetoin dehydrogenase alpha subunit